MPYEFATENQDYSDYSGGRVIYSQPGAPAFPIRLASEIFQRALHRLQPARPVRLYDPCCGGAYHLSALGFLHGEWIRAILASDIDEGVLGLARRNLGLLTPAGLERRTGEIAALHEQYGKDSHAQALHSAKELRKRLEALPAGTISGRVFQADALQGESLRRALAEEAGEPIDLVLTDLPYGRMTGWQMPPGEAGAPPEQMLEALLSVLQPGALVAAAADKAQKLAHPRYQRLERFQIGKRQVTFLQVSG
jgi:23S rRNA (guanine2535-N1)-methyltransferase